MARTDTTQQPLRERNLPRRRLPRSATDPDHLAAIGVMTPEEARKYKAYLSAVEHFERRFGHGGPQPWTEARDTLSELESLRTRVRDREGALQAMIREMPEAVRGRVGFYGEVRGELCLITGEASGQVKEFDECLDRMRALLEDLEHSRTGGGPADAVSPILDHLDALDRDVQDNLRAVQARLSND
jgi:hypothetical protein